MTYGAAVPTHYRFGPFELSVDPAELRKSGVHLKLQDQPFHILCALLEHPGELVTREQLRLQLWPEGTFVDFEHGLNTAIKKIRDVLGDDADTPRYIETIARKGYRFLAPLNQDTVRPRSIGAARLAVPSAVTHARSPCRRRDRGRYGVIHPPRAVVSAASPDLRDKATDLHRQRVACLRHRDRRPARVLLQVV